MAGIELVVTDLDGTLWHTEDEIAPAVVAAVHELEARGVPLLVATGRRLASTRGPLGRAGLAPPAVVLNGALGVDLATGERFHTAPFPTEEAVAVHAALAALGLQPVVQVDHSEVDVLLGPRPSTNPGHTRALLAGHGRQVADLAAGVAEVPVLGFSMIGVEHATCVAARDAVGGRAETHLDRSLEYPGLATLTVAPLGQSKWDGVLAFCALHALDPGGIIALGDGANDVELLDGAAVALVPAVAHPAALERADHVIPSAADGGWSEVLAHI